MQTQLKPSSHPAIKQLTINLLLLIISISGFLFILEFALRITGLQTVKPNPPQIYQQSENPVISYELKPNLENEPAYKATVSTDKNGFRISEYAESGQKNKLMAVLGDSITFGYGVHDNQSLPAQIEKKLKSHNSSLINAAVPGYQLKQQTATYKDKLMPLNPDAAMLVFFWNDLDGNGPGILDEDGILRGANWDPNAKNCQPLETGFLSLIPRKCWLDKNSAIYKAMKKVASLRASKQSQEENRTEESQEELFSSEQIDVYLNDLQTLAAILPQERYFVIWPDDFEHKEIRIQLSSRAEQLGFTVIDLYELFGNEVETLPWDTVHPSANAIEKAAAFIVNKMK